MDSRARFHAVMDYGDFDRTLFVRPWLGFPETEAVWKQQGMNPDDLDAYPVDAMHWITTWFLPHPPFERRVIEEDERHVLYVNHEGILMRELKDNPMSSMPQFVRFPVQTREDFRAFARERLQPDVAARLGEDWAPRLRALRQPGHVLWVVANRWGGFFGPLRNLLGVEELCMLFYTDPAFLEEMMDTFADFLIALADPILDVIEIDVFGFWEDMAYNHGPLIDPQLVRQYMLPRYKRVTEHLRSRGVRWFSLDSDGRIDTLVPIWLEGGINLIYPFEVAAGMDVAAMRKTYGPGLRMYMGLDKRVLVDGPTAIDAEIERVRPLMEEGGYIPNLDHSVPPDVPYRHFQYYMDRMASVLGVT